MIPRAALAANQILMYIVILLPTIANHLYLGNRGRDTERRLFFLLNQVVVFTTALLATLNAFQPLPQRFFVTVNGSHGMTSAINSHGLNALSLGLEIFVGFIELWFGAVKL